MIAAVLLLASATAPAPAPACEPLATLRSADGSSAVVLHAFQNGEAAPLRLDWIDPSGRRVDLGTIAPGTQRSLQTFVGHAFVLTDPAGRCRRTVRVNAVFGGTYVGTSRYRPVAIRDSWHVLVDRDLTPAADPARTALATLAGQLAKVEIALPPAALAQVRLTPIFLHDHAGPGAMFHPDPEWLVAHGRSVELANAIEVSDAGVFIETAGVQPGAILHELTHAYHARLPAEDRAAIEATYRRAMAGGLYRGVKRHDGSVTDAYARTNASEYFAEITEAYFDRNDFFPFTRDELARYDPGGERLVARLWR